ncbi:SURF1 family protein [Burkholderiales bacterium]|jgi:surfeit locus 1 family protein|nr:SURF1 family protein [Betaproteobacteria bacterium]MBT7730797.1 SURF1 family protein [Rhodospirillaceae bacterium]MDA9295672.1 SURF1 family protein [Burkholderiales bacterium]MDC3408577.1 SURF1 family protein [Burkholderiales bacterium]
MRHPSWTVTFIAILTFGLTLSAAYWQLQRAEHKEALELRFNRMQTKDILDLNTDINSSKDIEYRRVVVTGILDASKRMILDNRIRRGQAGYELLMPFSLTGSENIILINLGWIPRGRVFGEIPDLKTPDGVIKVTGTIVKPGFGALELSENTVDGEIWQNLDLSRYRLRTSLNVLNYVIQVEGAENFDTQFERTWPKRSFGIETHLSYAGQWLFFSFMTLFFYIYYGFIKQQDKTK